MADLKRLREAIKKLHGCDSKHVRSAYVREMFRGKIVWDGTVEVFDLIGHAEAKVAYAWAHAEGDVGHQQRDVTVLGIKPVTNPINAVYASIAAELLKRGELEI